MKFFLNSFYRTPLHLAIEKGHKEIVQLLMDSPKIDVQVKSVFILNKFLYHSKSNKIFNTISNHFFLIKFKLKKLI